ncbi:MAG: ATP-binding cassette domain-containing protein [Candidatus Omnitrophica bacterium]|jgi:ABC-type glutathione transport system ATPase component|nr:ATP-binding cassette domain-containing protein [Candidatus Omnitrophota bacterium]MDD5078901.1 ATP-binding cassette domain-containing protein [Candidatus Omnitrophota bacterium]
MILELKNVTKSFPGQQGLISRPGRVFNALDNVSFKVDEFTTLGIVGESGSGKTTLAKIILDLIPLTSGEVIFNRELIGDFRKDVQIIFQNPYNSLDPKMRIKEMLFEPLSIHKIAHGSARLKKAIELLQMVEMDETALNRYPAEFSGGQRQMICIARALASEPRLLVLDEPVSSLDLTIQARILELLARLKQKFRLTYIFISHNLGVVKYMADSVAVMREGKVVELAKAGDIFSSPGQDYTKRLLEAAALSPSVVAS